jgi:hypothetical protein
MEFAIAMAVYDMETLAQTRGLHRKMCLAAYRVPILCLGTQYMALSRPANAMRSLPSLTAVLADVFVIMGARMSFLQRALWVAFATIQPTFQAPVLVAATHARIARQASTKQRQAATHARTARQARTQPQRAPQRAQHALRARTNR